MIPTLASEIPIAILALMLRPLLNMCGLLAGCRRSLAVSILLSSIASVTGEVRVGSALALVPNTGLTESSQNHVREDYHHSGGWYLQDCRTPRLFSMY